MSGRWEDDQEDAVSWVEDQAEQQRLRDEEAAAIAERRAYFDEQAELAAGLAREQDERWAQGLREDEEARERAAASTRQNWNALGDDEDDDYDADDQALH